ncbi:hypothetical protein GCM10010435_11230 [Winogradskya consettensis]
MPGPLPVRPTPCPAWGVARWAWLTPCPAWGVARWAWLTPCPAWGVARWAWLTPCPARSVARWARLDRYLALGVARWGGQLYIRRTRGRGSCLAGGDRLGRIGAAGIVGPRFGACYGYGRGWSGWVAAGAGLGGSRAGAGLGGLVCGLALDDCRRMTGRDLTDDSGADAIIDFCLYSASAIVTLCHPSQNMHVMR